MKNQAVRGKASALSICALFSVHNVSATTLGVTLSSTTEHPQQAFNATGAGFTASEAVDVYIDTVDTVLMVANSSGGFTTSLTTPAAAQPGTHYVTAVGRKSGNAAQAAFTVSTKWPTDGFGATASGSNPFENTLNASNVGSLQSLWKVPGGGNYGAPTADFGSVFVASNQTGPGVQRLAAATGVASWKVLTSSTFYATPTEAPNTVYVGSTAGVVYALKSTSGASVWSSSVGGVIYSSPVVVNNLVYVTSTNDMVYALSASTGAKVWSYTTGGSVYSSVAVADGIVYVGSQDDKFYALNASTGTLIWSYTTGGAISGAPAVVNGTVYFGSADEYVYALNSTNGGIVWRYQTNGLIDGPATVANGTVFIGSHDQNIYALDSHSGALKWSFQTGGAVAGGASIANGVLYLGSADGFLYGLNASTGTLLFTANSGSQILSRPIVSDGRVFVNGTGNDDGSGEVTIAYNINGTSNAATKNLPTAAPKPSELHPNLDLAETY